MRLDKMAVETRTTGLTKNIFHIIEGTRNRADNVAKWDIDDAKDGVVAAVIGPNQTIVDTDYYPMNELIGLHQLKVRWFTSITSGNGLVVQYWKKDADGNETHTDVSIGISAAVGNIGETFGNSADKLYFSPNYQYRIKVISDPSILDTDYVSIDFIGLLPINEWNLSTSYVLADSGGPRLLSMYPTYVVVTGNGSAVGTAHYSYSSEEGAAPFAGLGNVTIQATATSSSTSTVFVPHIANMTSTGFDIIVGCLAGNWSGQCGVMIEIIGYLPVTVL